MQVEFRWLETMWTSPMMLVILLVSVITMGFILERSIYFWKRRGDAESTRSAALARIRSGDVQGAMSRLAETRHPLGPVAASATPYPSMSTRWAYDASRDRTTGSVTKTSPEASTIGAGPRTSRSCGS